MLVLDTTTKTITVAMTGAPATTNPSFVTAYSDDNGTTFVEGSSDGQLNGTTQVTMVAAPAASTRRLIKSIFIENNDTAPVTIIVTLNNSGTLRNIQKITLAVGDNWSTDGVTDANGNFKQIGASGFSGYSGISGYSGFSGTNGTNGLSGYSGYSGYSGSGISGYSGYSGSGISGFSGYSGYSGAGGGGTQATATSLGTVYAKQTTGGGTPYLTAFGYNAGVSTTGVGVTAIGTEALFTNTGAAQTAVGYQAGYNLTTSDSNTVMGWKAMFTNTNGSSNVAIGRGALYTTDGGQYNVGIGREALYLNTSASNNTAVGYQAGYSNTGAGAGLNGTVFIGYQAGYSQTTPAYPNVVIGYQAGYYNQTGERNVLIGVSAGLGTTGNSYTGNVCIGYNAGNSLTTGSNNTFVGSRSSGSGAGFDITTGSKNTIIGQYGGNSGGLDIRTSNNYVVLADGDGNPRGIFDNNGKLIVNGATTINSAHTFYVNQNNNSFLVVNQASSGPFGLQIRYTGADPNGSSNSYFEAYNSFSGATRFELRSNGGLANYSANNVNLSDRREKTNFAPAKSYLDTICAIPVQTFNYIDQNLEEDSGLTLGVVAQDVQAVAPELVMESNWAGKDDEPKMRLSIYQTDLQYALMKAIQELSAKVTALENKGS